jgi:cyclic 2,3-diphosphoglycerate synthetase
MGRGGPPEPEFVDTRRISLTPETLLEVAEGGGHAASDYWEDALLGQVPTVGCRRCGGGMGGNPFASNVLEGAEIADGSDGDFVVMEGSGATFAPVTTDRRMVIVGAGQPIENVLGFLGEYRLLISDLALVTMCEPPVSTEQKVNEIEQGIARINPECEIALTVFRPEPLGDVEGKKVFVATTAQGQVAESIGRFLRADWDCEVIDVSTNLSNRPALRADLKEGLGKADVLLTEIKAASIDVAARAARDMGVEIVFLHNRPKLVGGTVENLEEAILDLCTEARQLRGGG